MSDPVSTSATVTSGERDATQPQVRAQADCFRLKVTNTQNSGEAEQDQPHAWFPRSPCGPGCLAGHEPSVSRPLRWLRLLAVVLVVLLAVSALPLLALVGRRAREVAARLVFRLVLVAVGVRLRVFGAGLTVRGRGVLVVHNHISWLDVVAVSAVRPMRALAKSEIARWPVLGWLVSAGGSVYVDRAALRSLPATVTRLAGVLRGGSMVAVTPEGTTWCGLTRGRFRPAAFQAAIDGGVPVLPVALRFRLRAGEATTAPAFIGTETIVESVRRVVALRGLVLEVHVLDEIAPGRAADRRELAALAETAVDTVLAPAPTAHPVPPVRSELDVAG
jgi:1-acyl-sn-glycerol-3-phosphate acyltransferase